MSPVTPIRADPDLPWETPPVPAPAPEPDIPRKRKPKQEPQADTGEPPADQEPPQRPSDPDEPPFPFTLLGHDHGVYFYMGHGTQQLTALKASQHTPLNLNVLAPPSFWERRWPSKRGFDSDQAAGDLMTAQHRIGVYSANRIRGRGAWWDEDAGHAVVHLGDRLLINGAEHALTDHGTRYIYEQASALPIGEPLRNSEAVKLAQICGVISWEKPVSARLLSGWIVNAAICGALRWKPNIYLLGPKEAGKSTVVEKIVFRALGENVLYCLGGTTEASLRALLRADAMPVIIDDMDSDTARGRENTQAVMELMRIFSGEGGGARHKASQSGGAPSSYKIHSCYIYSGIRLPAENSADVSRIAPLKLLPRKFERDQYENFLSMIGNTLTPEFAAGLFSRCIKLIPVIRKNAETFAQAVAEKTGSRRSGDVNGHLFAGAYSLHSEGLITREAAAQYVGSRDEVMALMHEEKQNVAENNEGGRCLAHLMEQVLTDTLDGRMMKASIYDLVQRVHRDQDETATGLLRRTGILISTGSVIIANEHSALRDLYAKSSWPSGWSSVLRSVTGATVSDSRKFGARSCRGTMIPFSAILDVPIKLSLPFPDDPPGVDM